MIASLVLFTALLAQGPAQAPDLTPAEKQFQDMLTNVTLSGYFTVGDSGETHEDKYIIRGVTKGRDDQWAFDAQIIYGGKNYGAKVTVPVKWAGDAPVLSMAQYMISGQGVFSARILMYNGMYAGTWGSQEHGGKMFGKIVKNDPAPPAAPPPQ
jgi:hypothetical protein